MALSPIAQILLTEMARAGLNQRSLAAAAGLHRDAVRNILRGKSVSPRGKTIQALAACLQIPPSRLLGVEDQAMSEIAGKTVGRPDRLAERKELLKLWDGATQDGKALLLSVARTIARAEMKDEA
jgi:transcriptional regulator with XRE-family HTH domain